MIIEMNMTHLFDTALNFEFATQPTSYAHPCSISSLMIEMRYIAFGFASSKVRMRMALFST